MQAWVPLLVALALMVSGCATMDPREDVRIEAEVKARLVAEKTFNLTRVGVLSTSGAVESTEARAQAATLAGGVGGVARVVNTLEVRPAP